MAAAVQITSGISPASVEGKPKNNKSTPDAIITIDQKMRAFAPYLLIAYQFALDVNAFEIRNPQKRFIGIEPRRKGRLITMNKMPHNMLGVAMLDSILVNIAESIVIILFSNE